MVGESRISRGRGVALALLSVLLLGVVSTAPARAAATPFNPVVTAGLGTDAARAPSSFSLKITQQDGEEQIGPLSIVLPRNPGFTVNTDVPGPDRQQIGSIHVVLYTGASPGRAPLTIDGTLNDDNSRAGCGGTSGRQCIVAILAVPGVGTVTAQLEIYEDSNGYRISGDLTDTWSNSSVAQIDGRLAELSTTLVSSVGSHTVVRNAEPGTWPLRYTLSSAAVAARGLHGDIQPPCAPDCKVDLVTAEHAPTAPVLQAPAAGSAYLVSSTPTTFTWAASTDRNGDPVTYTLVVDGAEVAFGSGLAATKQLAPGRHSWQVRASDDHSGSTLSGVRYLTVIDPVDALTFTSAISNDKLYVVPGAFVYKIPNNPYPLGAETATATADHGVIAYLGGFTLGIAYDGLTKSAAGYLNLGSLHRVFTDPPGA